MTGIYRCVQCGRASLSRSRTAFSCTRCGSHYPIVFNVPLFLPRFNCRPSGFHLHRDVAEALCDLIGAEKTALNHFMLHQIHSYDYTFGKTNLEARNNRLLPLAIGRQTPRNEDRKLEAKVVSEIERHWRPGMRILELGSTTLATALPRQTHCVDTDIHALQISQVAQRGDLPVMVADFAALPFVEQSFDAVVCDPLMTHFIRYLLKPNGILLASEDALAPIAA